MAVPKEDTEFTDALGNLHKHFADGRSEIYYKGTGSNPENRFMEITDGADEAVNRRRFLPWTKSAPIADTLETRDNPEEMPGDVDLDAGQ